MPNQPQHKWTGAQSHGRVTYTDAERYNVVAALIDKCRGEPNAISAQHFAENYCGSLDPRTVRAIVADRDGIDYLLANPGDRRQWVCETADEGDATTRRLTARATTELQRAARRTAYANTKMHRQQQAMAL